MNFRKKFSPAQLFFLLCAFQLVVSVFQLFFSKGEAVKSILFAEGEDAFMDFFNYIFWARNRAQVYSTSSFAVYGPLGIFFYYILNRMLPSEITAISGENIRASTEGMLLYVFYTIFITIVIVLCIQTLYKRKESPSIYLLFLIIFSSGCFIAGIFERGNLTYLVLALLMAFFAMRNSTNFIFSETALILLALAAGIKFYPALFGLLYIREKKYGESIRLIVYGILFFIVPLAFMGGCHSLKYLLSNISSNQGLMYTSTSSIQTIFSFILDKAGSSLNIARIHLLGKIVSIVFLVISLVIPFSSKTIWKQQLFICGVIILFPSWSASYASTYMLIPLVEFLNCDRKKAIDYWFAILFSFIFSLSFMQIPELNTFFAPKAGVYALFPTNTNEVLRNFSIVLLVISATCEWLFEEFQGKRTNKASEQCLLQ